jgi:3-mercaptopyruvate sulfurtransferase SseA
MARAGIGDGDRVVAVDDAAGVVAARLVWMLRVTGHQAALLDGGVQPEDALTGAPAGRPPATFTPGPGPAPAACRAGTTSVRTAGCVRRTSCARAWPPPGSTGRGRWSRPAARA